MEAYLPDCFSANGVHFITVHFLVNKDILTPFDVTLIIREDRDFWRMFLFILKFYSNFRHLLESKNANDYSNLNSLCIEAIFSSTLFPGDSSHQTKSVSSENAAVPQKIHVKYGSSTYHRTMLSFRAQQQFSTWFMLLKTSFRSLYRIS